MFYLYNCLVGFDIYILSGYILLARRLLDIPIQALVDVLFIMLTNVELPTIVGILTFISTINFMLS